MSRTVETVREPFGNELSLSLSYEHIVQVLSDNTVSIETIHVAVDEALHEILKDDIVSKVQLPADNISKCDGWLWNISWRNRTVERVYCLYDLENDRSSNTSNAVGGDVSTSSRIATLLIKKGMAIPPMFNCLIAEDDADLVDDTNVRLHDDVIPHLNMNISLIGTNVQLHQPVVSQGTKITQSVVAACIKTGNKTVRVTRLSPFNIGVCTLHDDRENMDDLCVNTLSHNDEYDCVRPMIMSSLIVHDAQNINVKDCGVKCFEEVNGYHDDKTRLTPIIAESKSDLFICSSSMTTLESWLTYMTTELDGTIHLNTPRCIFATIPVNLHEGILNPVAIFHVSDNPQEAYIALHAYIKPYINMCFHLTLCHVTHDAVLLRHGLRFVSQSDLHETRGEDTFVLIQCQASAGGVMSVTSIPDVQLPIHQNALLRLRPYQTIHALDEVYPDDIVFSECVTELEVYKNTMVKIGVVMCDDDATCNNDVNEEALDTITSFFDRHFQGQSFEIFPHVHVPNSYLSAVHRIHYLAAIGCTLILTCGGNKPSNNNNISAASYSAIGNHISLSHYLKPDKHFMFYDFQCGSLTSPNVSTIRALILNLSKSPDVLHSMLGVVKDQLSLAIFQASKKRLLSQSHSN